jgi:capsular exopolysaccharide synthesis family protein
VTRVFDALRRTGTEMLPASLLASESFGDAHDKRLQLQSFATATIRPGPESHLVFQLEPNGPSAERYRLLRHRLQSVRAEIHVKTLLLTSPGAKEGKSTVSLNLAAALAEKNDQRVILLEGDLRCPSLTRELGLTPSPGLTDCPRTDTSFEQLIWRIEPFGFYLLPAGKALDNPTELLNSEWFSTLIGKLTAYFDWVVIDAPPVLPVVDALSLKRFADASIVVAWAGRTRQEAITEAIRILGRNHVLGVVLNALAKVGRNNEQYYRYYTGKG